MLIGGIFLSVEKLMTGSVQSIGEESGHQCPALLPDSYTSLAGQQCGFQRTGSRNLLVGRGELSIRQCFQWPRQAEHSQRLVCRLSSGGVHLLSKSVRCCLGQLGRVGSPQPLLNEQ